jgi:hypothetical protein
MPQGLLRASTTLVFAVHSSDPKIYIHRYLHAKNLAGGRMKKWQLGAIGALTAGMLGAYITAATAQTGAVVGVSWDNFQEDRRGGNQGGAR